MALKYLITGATGGLGSGVIDTLTKHLPKSAFAASSSRQEAAKQFEDVGIQFRHADYDDPESLEEAFTGVEKLFFVSSSTYANIQRGQQHRNVINAAKKTGVGHVCDFQPCTRPR